MELVPIAEVQPVLAFKVQSYEKGFIRANFLLSLKVN
jgi:hypothetical protein